MRLVSSAIRLHNFIIDEEGCKELASLRTGHEQNLSQDAFKEWWKIASSFRQSTEEQTNSRSDLQVSSIRDSLTRSLKSRGITRPALS